MKIYLVITIKIINKMEINKLIETLESIIEKNKPSNKTILTNMFKILVEDSKEDCKDFKSHLQEDVKCICTISEYANFIVNFESDELREIIKETGITEETLKKFFNALHERRDELVHEVDTSLGKLSYKIYNSFEHYETKPNLESMTKEELIKYIKENNK